MKALQFIRKLNKKFPGIIAGGYALHLDLGTEFTDIDFFTSDPEGHTVGDYNKVPSKLLGLKFVVDESESKSYGDKSRFVSMRRQFDDYVVNVIFLRAVNSRRSSPLALLRKFDISITQVATSSFSDFKVADLYTDAYKRSILYKQVVVTGGDMSPDPSLNLNRVIKYQKRLGKDYTFTVGSRTPLTIMCPGSEIGEEE